MFSGRWQRYGRWVAGRVLGVSITLMLGGCLNLSAFVQSHGHVARDDDPVREDGRPVYIPPNAPSVHNGYGSIPDDYEEPDGHMALDIVDVVGAPVLAVAPGVVVSSYYEPMHGNQVMIDHGPMANGQFVRSYYAHLDSRIVEEGDSVVRGQQIGTLGQTGTLALLLPHLHYEILTAMRKDQYPWVPDNPHRYWMDGVGIVTCFERDKRYADIPFRATYPLPCLGVAWH